MHARSPRVGQLGVRTWIVVAIAFALLALIGVLADSQDLGDGLVLGSNGAVSAVWERASAHGAADDFLLGNPSAERAATAR